MERSRILSNSVALVVQDIASKLIPLVTFPLVARALGPETYGKYGFAAAVTSFFGLLASPGFLAYGAREVARNPEDAKTLVGNLMGARIGLASFSYLLLVIYTFTFAPADPLTRVLLLLTGLTFLVTVIDLQWLFMGQSLMWRISNANVVARIINGALIVLLIRAPKDVWVIPVSGAIASVAGSGILLALAAKAGKLRWPVFRISEWAGFLPICFTLGTASMMSMIYDQIDTVMLRYLRSEVEVGLYTASYRIMTISMSFLAVGAQIFFPLFSSSVKDPKKERQYVQWMADSTVAIAAPMAAGGFILARQISGTLLGAKFSGSEELLKWLMFNLLAASFAVLTASRLVPHGRERAYLSAVALGAVANIGLNLVFLPRYGAIAAVWTTIVSQLCVGVLAFWNGRDLVRPVFSSTIKIALVSAAIMSTVLVLAERELLRNVFALVGLGAVVYAVAFSIIRRTTRAEVSD